MEKSRAIEEVLAAGRELVARGLVARTWGNISCRIDDKSFAITPSGIDYARLTPETIVQVDMESLAHEGPVKPSSEKGIHAAAYRLDPDTQFVIHTHQTCASCLGIAGFHTLKLTAEEKEALGGDLLLAPYGLPGSKSLRKKVEEKLKGSRVILMERHGILITGSSRGEAFDRSVVVEDICCRAMKGLSFSHDAPESVSSKDQKSCLTFKNQPQEEIERIHQALHQACPDLRFILHRTSPAIRSVMEKTRRLPALLDDFAQLVGSDIRLASSQDLPALARAARGRNAVLVEDIGVFCLAGEEADAEAILTLVEKNALCYLNASRYGKPEPLSWLDRKLMRLVYTRFYSKKK